MYQKNWENLAIGIVKQAVDDYRDVLKNLKIDPYSYMALRDRKELESFFTGDWITQLTTLSGEWLMNTLQMEVSSR